jgi:hypothetical protein
MPKRVLPLTGLFVTKTLAPWYNYVEGFAGISGSKEGLPQLPDGNFLPPMDLNCVEKDVSARIKEKMNRNLIIGRVANLTAAIEGRTSASFVTAAGRAVHSALISAHIIYAARCFKNSKLTVRPFSIVTKLLYNKDTQR